LVLKYGTLSRTELLNDFYFIIGFAKIKKKYNGVVDFLENFSASENTKNFNFALFSNIFSYKHNVKQLLQSWNISSFIGVYPSCFETLIILESFKKMVDDLIANADEYDTKTYSKNKEILFNADYKQLRKNLAETIASQDAKDKDVFKLQNKLHILEEYCHDFNINKDNKNSDAPAIVTEDTNYSQEQLQAFASGSLF
jgi:nitrate/TMAO reductase-like tetraheme cytochrome c subunit